MYKRASRAMIHAQQVNAPRPTGGYIGSTADEKDVLPNVEHMSVDALKSEQRQLRSEVLRVEQEIAVAKVTGHTQDLGAIKHQKAVLTLRLSAVNKAFNRKDSHNEYTRLCRAAREIVGEDTFTKIMNRMKELRSEPAPEIEVVAGLQGDAQTA